MRESLRMKRGREKTPPPEHCLGAGSFLSAVSVGLIREDVAHSFGGAAGGCVVVVGVALTG